MNHRQNPLSIAIQPFAILIAILLAVLAAGCTRSLTTPAFTAPEPPAASEAPTRQSVQAVLNSDVLESYAAELQIQFSGQTSWSYQLAARKTNGLREINLHMDGLPPAQNPGDIRLVTDGTVTRMIGAGTEQECIQFTSQQGMDPSFLYPETLVSMPELGGAFQLVGEEPGAGVTAGAAVTLLHFRATGASTGPWTNATIDIWQDSVTGMLHRFSMQAGGEDPFFGTGAGRLAANYRISEPGDQPVEPVAGCEITVRLPMDAAAFVRLPGMASFESPSNLEAVQRFYQLTMLADGWAETEPPAQAGGATILSYNRGAEAVEIYLEAAEPSGSKVKLLFIQAE